MDLRPGDIVCERSPGWIGRAVRWATRGRYEPPTRINHVALGVSVDGPEGPEVIEALWRVVRRPLSRTKGEIEVWRLRGIKDKYRWDIVGEAYTYLGRRYGVGKIIAHLVDALLTKALGREIYAARRFCRQHRYPICSWVVAWAYFRAVDYAFGVPPTEAAPDDIHDWLTASPGWELVYHREAIAA